jgi:LmbE family N-acetylglucosaminyl deacetylase
VLNIAAIGAHPDDIEIFMYGFLAAAKARGDSLALIVATDGAAGMGTSQKRTAETKDGLANLGSPQVLGLPDGGLAHTGADRITEAINTAKPDLILTHSPHDYHPDHRALSSYVTDAAGFRCPVLFADTLMGVGFSPDYYVDITPHIEAKAEAIMAHESQQPKRFVEAMRMMNRYRAAQCNAPEGHYAEAYQFDRRFPFVDLRMMLPPAPPYRPFYVADSDALI